MLLGSRTDRRVGAAGVAAVLSLVVAVLYCVLLVGLLGVWAILVVPIYLIATLVLLVILAGGQVSRPLRLPLAVGGATASLSVLVVLVKISGLT